MTWTEVVQAIVLVWFGVLPVILAIGSTLERLKRTPVPPVHTHHYVENATAEAPPADAKPNRTKN